MTFDGDQFQLVVTEDRFCDDRPGGIFHRAGSIERVRLALGDVATLGARDRGFAYAASSPSGWAVCSGSRLFRSRAAGWSTARPAGPPSAEITLCQGLAHHGSGWTVARDVVDEDVFLHQLLRLSGDAARETSYRTAGRVSVVSAPGGVMALSYPFRAAPPSYLQWLSSDQIPEEHPVARLDADIRATAIAPWPFAGDATALFFASPSAVWMRVVDQRARVLIEQTYAVGREGYEPDGLSVAVTNRGVVVAVGYRREGRQLGYFRSLMSLDETGALAQEIREEHPRRMHPDGPWGGPASVSVAARGDTVLVHQLHGESEETDRTEVLLLGCQ